MMYTLGENDDVYITTLDNIVHEAKAIESTNFGLYICVEDMGHFTVKWESIRTIHKIIKREKNEQGLCPRFKILIWRNENSQQRAS